MTFLDLIDGKNHPTLREPTYITKPLLMSEIAAAIWAGFRPDLTLKFDSDWFAMPRRERAILVACHMMTETGNMIAQYDYAERQKRKAKR